MQVFVWCLFSFAFVGAFLPPSNPPTHPSWKWWDTRYNMSLSTISMACNSSGEFNVSVAAQFGIISFDWSNEKAQWAAAKPMDCEERLVDQAKKTHGANPLAHVFVYQNLVKALPWYSSVRAKLDDPAYSGWFLKFAPNFTTHVPRCDPVLPGLCSELYHDQEQTPQVPTPQNPHPDGECVEYCDCGKNPCGEYLWDHRNDTLRNFLINDLILGSSALGNPAVSGLFIDDFWCSNLINGSGACTDPVQGPSEIDKYSVQDMGLTDEDVADITRGWLETMTAAQKAILAAGGYTWSLIPGQHNANASPLLLTPDGCAEMVRPACVTKNPWNLAPLMFGITPGQNSSDPIPQLEQDMAAFLLMRGSFAYIGWGVWGMSWPVGIAFNSTGTAYARPPEMDTDYGFPLGSCVEDPTRVGLFTREYSKAHVTLDCEHFTASIVLREDDEEQELPPFL